MAVRAVRKSWKDSAGIVLISGSYRYARPAVPIQSLVDVGKNPLIVSLRDEREDGDREWGVTLVKRSSKTGFYGVCLTLYHSVLQCVCVFTRECVK